MDDIRRAISETDVFILLYSETYMTKPFTQKGVGGILRRVCVDFLFLCTVSIEDVRTATGLQRFVLHTANTDKRRPVPSKK